MAKSLQDILKRRQQGEFVGREEQLSFFHRNLRWEVDDPRRRFIISVSGQGGVGKTWLLRRFRKIAEEFAVVTAYADESTDDVPNVMGRVAEHFEVQEHSLKAFGERYRVYRQRRQEIESDPETPQGFAAFLGRTLAKGGLRLARQVPIGGMVADFVDEEAFAELGSEFASYVARKIGNKDEVKLVLEPVEVLTPLLLSDLRQVAEKHPVALFFDTYERTGDFLDPWVRDLLEGCYGGVPANILLVIAGRDALDRNLWAPYEGLLARLPLDPFTEKEAREYLIRKGITDQQVVEVILHLSGRLPLLVATLAAESPDNPAKVGDPSGEAVERFLKWVEDPKRRQVALDAALPRRLNRDVLAVLVGEEEADTLFAWLKDMPFIERRGDSWAYHDVVRSQMLRYKRQETPQGWATLHGRLAEHYNGLRDGLGLEEEIGRRDDTWQRHALEALYHCLCQAPQTRLTGTLNYFIAALKAQRAFAQLWAGMMSCAGEDAEARFVQEWGRRLGEGMKAYDEDRYEEATKMFTALLDQVDLEVQWRAAALDWRGYLYYLAGQYLKASTDLTEAINLAPGEAEYWADRGSTYLWMERYQEALADFDQAIELKPDHAWAIAQRGETCRLMEGYQEALADFDRAIELKPDHAWAIAQRGETCRLMERYQEALADFDRAIELKPDYAWAIASRGQVYQAMERYQEALADFDRALELDPNYAWAIVQRGMTYREMERYQEALVDFDRAIELNADYAWAIAQRGITYRETKRYEEALADFDRVIELKADYSWPIAQRGITYRETKRYEEALADFDRAIELKPADAWPIAQRGITYRETKRYEEALADFDRAIALKEDYAWAIAQRGETYRLMKRYQEALADFDRAIELDPDYAWAIAQRGETYRLMKRYQEALADFNMAIALTPDDAWAIAQRGRTYREMERCQEALTDFNRAIALTPDDVWAITQRGMTYWAMERYEEALADITRAIELDPDYAEAIAGRAMTYLVIDRHEEALADFNRAIQLDANYDLAFFWRGMTCWLIGRYAEALDDLNNAVRLDPNDANNTAWRGLIFTKLGHYEEAIADLNHAIELDPADNLNLLGRGLVYHALGQMERAQLDLFTAIQHTSQTYDQEPENWDNMLSLVLCHLAMGETEDAEYLLQAAHSRGILASNIHKTILGIKIFLHILPNPHHAQSIHDLLRQYLQGAKV
jgi:tetratricopeptide (TPR) repeat protein